MEASHGLPSTSWGFLGKHQTLNFLPFPTTVIVLPQPILASKKSWGGGFKTDLLHLLRTTKKLIMPLLVIFSAKFRWSPFESTPKLPYQRHRPATPQCHGLSCVLFGLVLHCWLCARHGAGPGARPLSCLCTSCRCLRCFYLRTIDLLLVFFSLCLSAVSCPSCTEV